MNNRDNAIMQSWNSMLSLYGRTPLVDQVAVGMLLSIFDEYTTLEVTQAIGEYVKSGATYAPVPGQILELIRKAKGIDKQSLARKADAIYCEMDSNCNSTNDWIVADPRACVAINRVFGSPQNFARRNFSEYQEEKKRQAFIDAYCGATKHDTEQARNYFGGYFSRTDDPCVSFLGDYQRCLTIAKLVYVNRSPRLPQDPTTVKSLPKPVDRPLTPEEREYSRQMMSKALEILGNIKLRGRTC